MKSFKLLLLLGLLTVTGCKEEVKENTNNQETPTTTDTTRDESKENNNSTDTPSNNTEETNNPSSNNENLEDNNTTENNDNNEESNGSDEGNNLEEKEEGSLYTVSFVNPSCGTASTESLNDTLKTYLNEIVKPKFVTEVKNVSSQIANGIPTSDTNTLIIGAASKSGSVEIFFSTPIKEFTITAQTYHKPYVETWNGNREVANVDSNSVLAVTGNASVPVSFIDLKSEDEQPVEKTVEFKDFNCDKLHLYSANDEKGRIFVKEIKFVL